LFVRQKLGGLNSKTTLKDLQAVADLIEAGAVTPVIDRTYQLVEAPDAIRYLDEGHPRGKIVIDVLS
jgi:NADPH:quinone reductase-like Zn-dependent oxidoreductase